MIEAMKQSLSNMTAEDLNAVDRAVFILLHGWELPISDLRALVLWELLERVK